MQIFPFLTIKFEFWKLLEQLKLLAIIILPIKMKGVVNMKSRLILRRESVLANTYLEIICKI